MTQDDVLREQTHKGDGLDTDRRIYYTLTDNRTIQGDRCAKLLALLIARLQEDGTLTESQIDQMLLDLVT